MKRKLVVNSYGLDYIPKFIQNVIAEKQKNLPAPMNVPYGGMVANSAPPASSPVLHNSMKVTSSMPIDRVTSVRDFAADRGNLKEQDLASTGSSNVAAAGNVNESAPTTIADLWKDLREYRETVTTKEMHENENELDQDLGELLVDVAPSTVGKPSIMTTTSDPFNPSEVHGSAANAVNDGNAATNQAEAMTKDNMYENEKVLFQANCEVVLPSTNSSNPPTFGVLIMTKTKLVFNRIEGSFAVQGIAARPKRPGALACESLWACQPFPNTVWNANDIINVLQRYYRLRFVAAELFLLCRKAYFFNFNDYSVATNFQNILRKLVRAPYMQPFLGRTPKAIIARALAPNSLSQLSIAWANREISNFEYLMRLNTIAGRTYNDLGQYPIFPWVLADYSSTNLDLRNPRSYRDLRWPVGAQDLDQRDMLMTKYADLVAIYDPEDANTLTPFHFGTHYSVAGFVIWYLMRMEPYTSLHVQLQDGRIDRADRLFDSIEACWRGCLKNPSDVKELIPEFYYSPEMFMNLNKIQFGITQGGNPIDRIKLPAWAKDPYDFIRKHREALESEYVSLHLHHWIDLVFGYKQRPPHLSGGSEACVKACNVFFHLTYENAVDLEKLRTSNPRLYSQYLSQITEFGQTPCQLFTKEHVARQPLHKIDVIWPIASTVRGIHTIYSSGDTIVGMPQKMISYKQVILSTEPILFIIEDENDSRLITIDLQRVLGCHAWQLYSTDAVPPFKFKIDPSLAHYATLKQGNR